MIYYKFRKSEAYLIILLSKYKLRFLEDGTINDEIKLLENIVALVRY